MSAIPAPTDARSSKGAGNDGDLHAWFEKMIAAEDADRADEAAAQAARTAAADFAIYPCQTAQADAVIASALEWVKGPSGPKGGESSKYHKILKCRFARLYFLTLCRLPAHFRASKDMTIKTFHGRQGRDMGVRR